MLAILAVSFLLGGLVGCFLGAKLSSGEMISSFLDAARQQTIQPAMWREIWVVFRWPAAVLLLHLWPRSGVMIPALVFLRGLVLAYGIASMMLGASEAWCAWLIYGPTCLLTLPVLFVLAEEALLKKAGGSGRRSNLIVKSVLCLPVLLLCVFLDRAAVPPLLTWYLS